MKALTSRWIDLTNRCFLCSWRLIWLFLCATELHYCQWVTQLHRVMYSFIKMNGGALWLWSSLYTSCCKYLPERRMYINPQRKIVPKKTHHLLRNTMSSCLRNWNEWNYVFVTCCDCLLDKLRSLSSRRRVIVPLQDVRTTASSSFPFLLKCKVSLAPCWLSDNH